LIALLSSSFYDCGHFVQAVGFNTLLTIMIMKNVTIFRRDACTSFYLFFISICLFFNHFMSAQSTGVTLYWDSQVGCLAYGEDKDKGGLLETIGEDGCVKTCEQTEVNYYLTGTQIPLSEVCNFGANK